MNFTEIRVSQLESFVHSSEFNQLERIPITIPRALSQSVNPAANPDDIALVYSRTDEGILAGYIGILPAFVHAKDFSRIYFLTGWWVHPDEGRGIAMKLFFRMLEITKKQVFFFHLPDRMTAILKASGNFFFPPPINGFKGFMRFDMQNWIPQRYPRFSILKPFLIAIDAIANFPVKIRLAIIKSILVKTNRLDIEIIESPGQAELKFISEITGSRTSFRSIRELEWIKANPWISTDFNKFKQDKLRYDFSLLANQWEQKWLYVKMGAKIKAVVFLSVRDGLAWFPYSWIKPDDYPEISKCLAAFLIKLKIKSFITYNADLLKRFNEIPNLFIHKRSLLRTISWPLEMNDLMGKDFLLQDGDGDAVFT